jgi:endonuclease-3
MALHLSDRPFLGQKIGEYTPFQVLISTIISQRTRDENTDKASALLFAKYETAEKLAKAPEKEIARLIHACGFYNQKARRIKQVSELLVRDFGGVVPNSKEALLSLPGVGPKTANCVLVYGFSTAAIPVDTHVHRISNRLGLVKTKAPEQTEKELEKIYDRKDWMLVNDLFVRFGQTTCRPIGPKCATCPLNDVCPTGKRILLKSRKK